MKGDKLYTRLLVVEILPRASKLQFSASAIHPAKLVVWREAKRTI